MLDIRAEAAEDTAVLVRSEGGDEIFFVAADVGNREHTEVLVEREVAHYGGLDIACNNAGIGCPAAATADYLIDGWAQVININLSSVFMACSNQLLRCRSPAAVPS